MGKSGKRRGYRPRPEKIRREEEAAAATAALREERNRKLLRVTAIFVAVILLLLAAWGIFDVIARRTGLYLRQETAFSTPHCRVNGGMLAYYYHEYCRADIEENGETYREMGLDPAKPLAEQIYDAGSGMTWAAYFEEPVSAALLRMTVFAETAYREGLSRETESLALENADRAIANLRSEATFLGRSLAEHIAALYGTGVSEADVREAERLAAIAENRQAVWAADTFTAAERLAAYEAAPQDFSVADILVYQVKVKTDGLLFEDYREEYIRAENRAKALAAAESEEDFLAALRADFLTENPSATARDLEKAVESAYRSEIPYTATRGAVEGWLFADDRAAGDTAVLGAQGDYTVVFCRVPAAAPLYHSAAVRRIFFPYTAGVSEASLLANAKALLAGFAGGPADEAAFAAIAAEHGEDAVALAGGLVQSATRGDTERALADWLFAGGRTAGDTAVIPAAFGVYITYYVGENPYPLWEERTIERLREGAYARFLSEADVKTYPAAFDRIPAVVYSF